MIYLLVSIVVSIPACHAGDRGSIPRRGANRFTLSSLVRSTVLPTVFTCAFMSSQIFSVCALCVSFCESIVLGWVLGPRWMVVFCM